MKAISCITGRPLQYVAAIIGGLSAFSAGTALAWSSQITEELLDGKMGFPINSDEMGWIGSFLSFGAIASSLFAGPICDHLGRKNTMMLFVAPKTIGWCLMVWAIGVTMMYIGRFLTGVAAGPYLALSAIYICEVAENDLKTRLGSATALMIAFGALYSAIMGVLFNIRTFTISCAAIPMIFGFLLWFMPETPVHLIRKGNVKEARSVLKRIRNITWDTEGEIKEIESNVLDRKSTFTFAAFKRSEIQKACLIGFALMIFRQTSGIDAISSYSSYIFESAQLQMNSKIPTIIVNAIGTGGALLQVYMIRKINVKLLLLISSFVITISWTAMGIVFLLKDRSIIAPDYYIYVDYVPLVATILYYVAFSLGLSPIPWIVLEVLFPQELKSFAVSTGTFLLWVSSFTVAKVFLVVDDSLGADVAFFMFAGSGLFTFVFVAIFMPKIKNNF